MRWVDSSYWPRDRDSLPAALGTLAAFGWDSPHGLSRIQSYSAGPSASSYCYSTHTHVSGMGCPPTRGGSYCHDLLLDVHKTQRRGWPVGLQTSARTSLRRGCAGPPARAQLIISSSSGLIVVVLLLSATDPPQLYPTELHASSVDQIHATVSMPPSPQSHQSDAIRARRTDSRRDEGQYAHGAGLLASLPCTEIAPRWPPVRIYIHDDGLTILHYPVLRARAQACYELDFNLPS